jgi:hypothetical protein
MEIEDMVKNKANMKEGEDYSFTDVQLNKINIHVDGKLIETAKQGIKKVKGDFLPKDKRKLMN